MPFPWHWTKPEVFTFLPHHAFKELALWDEPQARSVLKRPVSVGLSTHDVQGWVCGQGAWRALPTELGLGAEVSLRTPQPQECNRGPLPWHSHHSQTDRMCGGREDRGDGGKRLDGEEGVSWYVWVCFGQLRGRWLEWGWLILSSSLARAALAGCHVWCAD